VGVEFVSFGFGGDYQDPGFLMFFISSAVVHREWSDRSTGVRTTQASGVWSWICLVGGAHLTKFPCHLERHFFGRQCCLLT
jgi:hypothetical protein